MPRFLTLLAVYAAAALVFVVLDGIWLLLVAADLFKRHVGHILRDVPDLRAALAFYIVYAGGLVVLAVQPAIATRSLSDATAKGGVLGFTAYATFDLTNLAIIKGWSLQLALVDMAWGMAASAAAAACGYAIGARLHAQAATSDAMRPE